MRPRELFVWPRDKQGQEDIPYPYPCIHAVWISCVLYTWSWTRWTCQWRFQWIPLWQREGLRTRGKWMAVPSDRGPKLPELEERGQAERREDNHRGWATTCLWWRTDARPRTTPTQTERTSPPTGSLKTHLSASTKTVKLLGKTGADNIISSATLWWLAGQLKPTIARTVRRASSRWLD